MPRHALDDHQTPLPRHVRAAYLFLSLLLTACGGGGGGGSGAGTSAGSVVSGSAVKGPLKGATVCVYAADATASNGLGARIGLVAGANVNNGCYVTGADGGYSLTLPAGVSRNVVVVSTGGSYCADESQVQNDNTCTGGTPPQTLPDGSSLTAAVTLPGNDGNASVHVTPLSQAAWQNALANHSSFDQEFTALRASLGLSSAVTPATAPASSAELKTLLGQVAVSISDQSGASLQSAIDILASGQQPTGSPDLACAGQTTLDGKLGCLLKFSNVTRLEAPPVVPDALYNAGQALFGSTRLSGAGTVSCSSCHATNNAGVETTLALHASLRGGGATIHRNAPDLVNKLLGNPRFMFWDGRVAVKDGGGFISPAGDKLPSGLDSILAVQALFPLLAREEMLGFAPGGNGGVSENAVAGLVADPVEANPAPVWSAIMDRIKADTTLFPLLKLAYPNVAEADLGIQHIANALAAFQTRRWNGVQATANFHGYLAGTADMTDAAKRGGILFFDKAGCYRCHNGPKFTDSKFHNLAVPQIGPGFGSGASETPKSDKGRYEVTGQNADLYAFLTPSLWEVKVTPPYFHNGVYATLDQVIRHHLSAAADAQAFRCASAPAGVLCRDSTNAAALYADMIARLAPEMQTPITLSDAEIADLITFLNQLTDGNNGP